MQYQKPHTAQLYGIGFLTILFCLMLTLAFTNALPYLYQFNWIALGACVLICCTPAGHQRLAATQSETPRYTKLAWLMRMFALEIALSLCFMGILLVCTHWLPVSTQFSNTIASKTTQTLLLHYGLFPWTVFAIIGVTFGRISYCQGEDASMSRALSPLLRHQDNTFIGVAINLQARLSTTAALATTFAFVTLLIMALITPQDLPFLTGFHIKTTLIMILIVLLGFTPPFKRVMRVLLHPKLPLFFSLFIALVFLALLLLLLNAIFSHAGQNTITPPSLITWIEKKSWHAFWLILVCAWWLCWTPLIGAHIARLSRGQRVRSVIGVTLLFPFIVSLGCLYAPNVLSASLDRYPTLWSCLAVLGFGYLLWQLTQKKWQPMLIRSYLPKMDQYKHRDHLFYCRKVLQLMLVIMYLYVPAGIGLIGILIFTLAFWISLQILLSILSFFFSILRS